MTTELVHQLLLSHYFHFIFSRSASKRFIAALQRSAQTHQKSLFSFNELKQVAAACGAKVNNFLDFLDSLNTQGFLIKKGSGIYQLLTVDYQNLIIIHLLFCASKLLVMLNKFYFKHCFDNLALWFNSSSIKIQTLSFQYYIITSIRNIHFQCPSSTNA